MDITLQLDIQLCKLAHLHIHEYNYSLFDKKKQWKTKWINQIMLNIDL